MSEANEQPEPAPVESMVICRFYWGREDNREGRKWGMISYTKDVPLPFLPRKGDGLQIMQCSTVSVEDVEYNVDDGYALVFLKNWDTHGDSWETIDANFRADGWTWLDNDGSAPCFRDR